MISEHSAHSTPLPFGFRTWLWRYTWHRQAISKLKGDKLSSSAECRIWTMVYGTESPADWMPAEKPTELSRIKQKLELNSPYLWSASIQPTRPHCHLAFALALAIYMYTFIVVNFDALAQARDFQIERRQVVFLYWIQDLNQGLCNRISNRLNARWQTDWAIEDQAKTWTQQPVLMISEHSAHSTLLPFGFRTWLWWYTCLLLLILMLWHGQAIFNTGKRYSNRKQTRCLPLLNAGFESRVSDTKSPANWMPADKPIELSRNKLKFVTQQPVPMISEQSAHSIPLPVGFRTWH